MRAITPRPMKADDFIAWAMEQPEGRRYELVAGEVVAMAPERVRHAEVKAEIWLALRNAVRGRGLPCQALPDGVTVHVDESTVYEPDALLRCGDPLADDTVVVPDPLIVVEVVSPSSGGVDRGVKLDGYFRVPSVQHYLIVLTDRRAVIHHRRADDGKIQSRIIDAGAFTLDPPGLELELADLFGAE